MNNLIQSTVRVAEIPAIISDPNRGIVSLVGDQGGTSRITGETVTSALIPGTMSIETEHGTIYLEPETETLISEESRISDDHNWHIAWVIETSASSPERAAAQTWIQQFGRTMAGADDACIFTVTDPKTSESVLVDLSKFDLHSLIV